MIKDSIKNYLTYQNLSKNIQIGLKYLFENDFSKIKNGRYDIIKNDVFAIVQDYQTKDFGKLESHREFIDIQYIVEGQEKIGVSKLNSQKPSTDYENDIVFYDDKPKEFIALKASDFAIFYPEDLHMPSIKVDKNSYVKKVVVKVHI